MARYNEILAGRYNRMLQKLFGTKGDAPAPQLAGDIQASFALFSGAEHRYLEAWQRYGISVSQAALAANNSAVRLRNPVGSNIIAIFEKILVLNGNAGGIAVTMDLAAATTDLTTIIGMGVTRFDARGTQSPTLIASKQNGAAGLGVTLNKLAVQILPTTSLDLIFSDIQEFPLLPGDAVQLVLTTVNNILEPSFWWRERSLEESERA